MGINAMMYGSFVLIMLILLFVGMISVLIALFGLFRPRLKGLAGEAIVNFWIRKRLDQRVYHLIPDVMLPTADGTTQIDHVVVSRYGIFVIETKNYKGWIYGSEDDAKWTQVIYKRKERFQNPLRQNHKHMKTISDLTGIPFEYFKSLIVFAGDSRFKTEMPDNVVYGGNLIGYIKGCSTAIIKDEQVLDITATIQEWAETLSDEQKRAHVKNLAKNHAPVRANADSPPCPRCSQTMVLRTNKRDSSKFWGCPGYPKCRGTRSVT